MESVSLFVCGVPCCAECCVWCGIALFGIVYVEGSSVAMCCMCVIACFARIDWVVMYGMWVVVFVFLSLMGWVVRRKRMSGASWYL